ncbi:MAG: ABC transporter substrate-binding protein [Deltaproteobacteria bacterium]|nr:ABC transporter substrate-binding protein [Deltaproteobacteria bacterium]
MRRIGAIAAALALLILLPGAEAPAQRREDVLLTLDWAVFGRHAGFFTALEKGFYRDEGLNVTISRGFGSLDTVKRIAAGRGDYGFADAGTLIGARAREGMRAKALAVIYSRAPHSFFFFEEAGIRSPKDLEGKTVAAAAGDANRAMFPAFAKATGIDPGKVNWLVIEAAAKTPMLLSGQAQIITEYRMHKALLDKMARGRKVLAMTYSDHGLDFYSQAIIAHDNTVAQKPDLSARFVRASLKGYAYAFDHADEGAEILKKHHREIDAEVARTEIVITKELAWSEEAQRNGLGYMDPAKMTRSRDLILEAYNIRAQIPVDDLYTNRFVPRR